MIDDLLSDAAHLQLSSSDRRLEALLEKLPDTVIYESGKGHDYVSSNIEQLLGYPLETFVHDRDFFATLIHPEDKGPMSEHFEEWKAHSWPKPMRMQFRARRSTGEYIWLEDQVRGVLHEDGSRSMIGVLIDITKRHQEDERYHAVVDAANAAGIGLGIYVDREGSPTPVYANEALATMIGRSIAELEGKPVFEFMPPEMWPQISGLWESFLAGEELKTSFESAAMHREGHSVPVSIGLKSSTIGNERSVIAFITDITERKRTEAALKASKTEAEEISRIKSNILANFSHELRTPMHAILGFSNLVLDEMEPANELRDYVESIERSAQRLLGTLTQILEVAALESGPEDILLFPRPVSELALQVVTEHRSLFSDKGLPLTFIAAEVDPIVLIEPMHFQKAMKNILANALKFTTKGSVTVRSWREVRKNEMGKPEFWAVISIRDTGIGMSREFLATAFDKFKQESTGFNRSFEGSGLGLNLARGYIRLMNGDIELESEPGMGTEVRVLLPAVGVVSEPPIA